MNRTDTMGRHTRAVLTAALLLLVLIAFAVPARATLQQTGDNPHGPLDLECNACHTTQGWDRLRPVLQFDHNAETRFPLEGQHTSVGCAACHTSLVFRDAGTECFDCHTDIHKGQFGNECSQCHTPLRWVDEPTFRQMHQETRFPLVGVHAGLDCQSCHKQGQYRDLSTECQSCHWDSYLATRNPDHRAAGFSPDCSECHASTSIRQAQWGGSDVQFVHTAAFPLTGGHNILDCNLCHQPGVSYASTSADCYACHEDNYNATTDPNHLNGNFGTMCDVCHSINAWRPADFADHSVTGFPLDGAHAPLACDDCHATGYTNTPGECIGCHRAAYEGVEDPNHVQSQFPEDCTECHTTSAWTPATFDHGQTRFPLTGAHTELACLDCHAEGYTGTPFDCWSCHEQDFNEVEEPPHTQDAFDVDCTVCHTTDAWSPSTFDHTTQTDYELTGAHTTVECSLCHLNAVYAGTPTDCWSCHEQDYNEAEDPNHVQQSFPQDCTICHSTAKWDDATFDHNQTNFPLTGAHIGIDCNLCHAEGYAGTPTDCWSCHEADYRGTNDPDHVAENFPQECTICHSTANWDAEEFDHNQTNFPLTGAHRGLDCTLCHADGYTGTPTDCWSCHEADYRATDDPDHEAGNYPHDCTECHTTDNWDAEDFDHNTTNFPLTGSHVGVACDQCHTDGFAGTPTDCYFCHQAEYDGTTDPNHAAAGFPQSCQECHNTVAWDQADFNHDGQWFPIYSGTHNNEWDSCSQCHPNGSNYQEFTCISCHEHSQSRMDGEHDEVGGYQYNSAACYDCHPDGRAEDDRLLKQAPREHGKEH